jgi:hypothetical protein
MWALSRFNSIFCRSFIQYRIYYMPSDSLRSISYSVVDLLQSSAVSKYLEQLVKEEIFQRRFCGIWPVRNVSDSPNVVLNLLMWF